MKKISKIYFKNITAGAEVTSLGEGVYNINGYAIDVTNQRLISVREMNGFEQDPNNPAKMRACYDTKVIRNPAYRGSNFFTNTEIGWSGLVLGCLLGVSIIG